jgi:hypothetical protein
MCRRGRAAAAVRGRPAGASAPVAALAARSGTACSGNQPVMLSRGAWPLAPGSIPGSAARARLSARARAQASCASAWPRASGRPRTRCWPRGRRRAGCARGGRRRCARRWPRCGRTCRPPPGAPAAACMTSICSSRRGLAHCSRSLPPFRVRRRPVGCMPAASGVASARRAAQQHGTARPASDHGSGSSRQACVRPAGRACCRRVRRPVGRREAQHTCVRARP